MGLRADLGCFVVNRITELNFGDACLGFMYFKACVPNRSCHTERYILWLHWSNDFPWEMEDTLLYLCVITHSKHPTSSHFFSWLVSSWPTVLIVETKEVSLLIHSGSGKSKCFCSTSGIPYVYKK